MPVVELFKTVIRCGLPYDQLIYEARDATTKWVHVSHSTAGNRGEIRIAEFDASGRPLRYPRISREQALAMTEPTPRSATAAAEPGYVEVGDEPDGPAEGAPGKRTPRRSSASRKAAAPTARSPARAARAGKARAPKPAPRKSRRSPGGK
jgi:hypothetical protein